MLYMIFKFGWELVLIQRILIGFKAILKYLLPFDLLFFLSYFRLYNFVNMDVKETISFFVFDKTFLTCKIFLIAKLFYN